jgi:hypothetical protein
VWDMQGRDRPARKEGRSDVFVWAESTNMFRSVQGGGCGSFRVFEHLKVGLMVAPVDVCDARLLYD